VNAYNDALAALYDRTAGGTRLGLERTAALLELIGNPQHRFRSLHVAGTNGKGSVVATLAAILRASGYRTGAYTSPHLVDFRERIVVNGEPVSEQRVVRFADEMLPHCNRLGATFFEATTALAFADFAERGVELAVVETGLGGRLDSTNVLLPEAATVTSVALDHTDLLGESLSRIAAEKSGIFKHGVPAVIGESDPAVAAELMGHAVGAGAATITDVAREWKVADIDVDGGTSFTIQHGAITGRFCTPLVGEHQALNTVTALATLAASDLLPDPAVVAAGLAAVRLPARFQRHGSFIFDVAHNRSAAHALAGTLALTSPARPVVGLLGVMIDKDWRSVLAELAPVLDRAICTNPPSAPAERRWDPEAAARAACELGIQAEAVPDFAAALHTAASRDGTVLVTGSFHTVGDAMSRLQVNPFVT
jgi:dihydrofolate synthase/folylpolyglutamate synthase